MTYDAFISYSHAADGQLAPAVQRGLQRLARPWWKPRALNVFRDETGLSVNPHMWASIEAALVDSDWFVLMASPDAAASPWVKREIETWVATKPPDRILPVLTAGTLVWDETIGDFSADSTAMPEALRNQFRDVPRYLDLRWAHADADLELGNSRFRGAIAGLAAPIHGVPPDELEGEDIRLQRRAKFLARAGVGALVFLLLVAAIAAFAAIRSSQRANQALDREKAATAQERVATRRARVAGEVAARQRKRAVSARGRADAEAAAALREAKRAEQATGEANASANRALLLSEDLIRSSGELDSANGQLNLKIVALDAAKHDVEVALVEQQAQRVRAEQSEQAALVSEQAAQQSADEAQASATAAKLSATEADEQRSAANAQSLARVADQLIQDGGQNAETGVLVTAEALAAACAASDQHDRQCGPESGDINSFVRQTGQRAASSAGRPFVAGRIAGDAYPFRPLVWQGDGSHFAMWSIRQKKSPFAVELWDANRARSVAKLTGTTLGSDVALSSDGTTLITELEQTSHELAVWSVGDRKRISPAGFYGRKAALAGDASIAAWLPVDRDEPAVQVWDRSARTLRKLSLPSPALDLAVSADGASIAALTSRGADLYSVIPIDASTGQVGEAVDVGSFATVGGGDSSWTNHPASEPRSTDRTDDPPALWPAKEANALWVYNFGRHVELRLGVTGGVPSAEVARDRTVPASVGDRDTIKTATPDGRTAVLPAGTSWEVWRFDGAEPVSKGVLPIAMCARYYCDIDVSPDGKRLVASSTTALQVLDLAGPTSADHHASPDLAGLIPLHVVASPRGDGAVTWDGHTAALIGADGSPARVLPLHVADDEIVFDAAFAAGGASVAVLTTRLGGICPCRTATFDARTGAVQHAIVEVRALDVDGYHPNDVAVSQDGSLIAVTLDDGFRHAGCQTGTAEVVTSSARDGHRFRVIPLADEGLGAVDLSEPAVHRRDGRDVVAVVARGTGDQVVVAGIMTDARRNDVPLHLNAENTYVNQNVCDPANVDEVGMARYYDEQWARHALRFTSDRLVWNSGETIVSWEHPLRSDFDGAADAVLDPGVHLDPEALAVGTQGSLMLVRDDPVASNGERRSTVELGDVKSRVVRPFGDAQAASLTVGVQASGDLTAFSYTPEVGFARVDTWDGGAEQLLKSVCARSSRSLSKAESSIYVSNTSQLACAPKTDEPGWETEVESTEPVGESTEYERTEPCAITDFETTDCPIDVESARDVFRAEVDVRIDHTFDSDLNIALVTPAGREVPLVHDTGGGDNNFGTGDCSGGSVAFTTFTDSAALPISVGQAPFVGPFRPMGDLRSVTGRAGGTWRLRVRDFGLGDTGAVQCWKLRLYSLPDGG